MKLLHFINLLAALLFLPLQSFTQTNEVKFHLVTGSNGIDLGKINGMTRDRSGAMWFSDQSSGCITRYDGSLMTRYWYDDSNDNSLGGWYPECLLADTSGLIWIGFYGQGLDRFDPETNAFTHYRHIPNDPQSLSNDTVTALLIDHLGNFWVATYGGLELFDEKSGTFTHFGHKSNDPTSLSHNRIRALYEDREGTIWVGTGLAWDLNDHGGLNRFDRETGTFTRYLHDPQNPNSLVDNKVRAIFEDSRGNFWVGTRGDGLHRLDRKTGVVERYSAYSSRKAQPRRSPVLGEYDHITFITEDALGHLWIGTLANGLCKYDPDTGTNTIFNASSNEDYGFSDNTAWCVHVSADGLFWVSTQEASLFQVELYQNTIPHFALEGLSVTDFIEEETLIVWMATSRGLIRNDLNTGKTEQYVHDPQNPNSLNSGYPDKLLKQKDSTLWISSTNGLTRFDLASRNFKRYQHDPQDNESLSFNSTGMMCEDSESNLWIITYGGGLNRLDTKSELFMRYRYSDVDSNSISDNFLATILPDASGDIWVGAWNNGGINRLNPQTGHFKHYLPGHSVADLLVDTDGVLWAGTGQGLYRYDRTADRFVAPAQLNAIHDIINILSILVDDDNNLWIATSAGLFRLDAARQNVVRLSRANGINGASINFGSSLKSKSGKLFIGTQTGYYAFHPDDLKILSSSVNVQLTNLLLDGKVVTPGPQSPIRVPLNQTNSIRFRHHENVFSIGFSMINFGDPEDKVIYYKLENYDQDWRQAGAEGQAYYYNLPPGKYKFMLKASNLNFDKWAERSVEITKSPPWWNTTWAYGLYGILVLSVLFFGYRFQKQQWLKAERERTKDRELAQAREIEKAYNELKSTQALLIQSEKMASLGELTAGIAHEIQNPLNFVNNFSEVNKELLVELKEEIDKGNMSEVKTIADSVIDNEEKIMHHGKRADAIVKSMLYHSRSSSGVKEPTDINALADEYLRLAYHGLRAKDKSFNATMKTDFDDSIGKINVIPQDIGRVILNLITNAFYACSVKAKGERQTANGEKQSSVSSPQSAAGSLPESRNEAGPQSSAIDHHSSPITHGSEANSQQPIANSPYTPTVTVSSKNLGDKIEIRVKDNGIGIPEHIKDKIFQPFFTTKPTGQGTGLGLSLSYDIIKAHGGEMTVRSTKDVGTQFSIILPLT